MKVTIPIRLAVEDELSEWVARRVLAWHSPRFAVGAAFRQRGYGYLKRNAPAFNNAAKGCPFLLLTDLDQYGCPPSLITDWLVVPKHRHFLFRVAVREIESWLLGDAVGLSRFLGLRQPIVLPNPETVADPKRLLLQNALQSPRRSMRESIVWRDDRSGRVSQGPDYNGALVRFVSDHWDVDTAKRSCPSLQSFSFALSRLEAEYE